jgi:heme/copper-type cytochrome/quinol oxidase subunit 2
MAWAGKPVKDFSTMFWAMAQIAVVVIGLILYFKIKAKKKMSQI